MSYNTIVEFKKNAIPLGAFDKLENDTIQYHLDAAYSLLNVHLGIGNTVPLSNTDASIIGLVKYAELIIASYRLMNVRGVRPNTDGNDLATIQDLYAEVMAPDDGLLTQLRKRIVILDKEASQETRRMNLKVWGTPRRPWIQTREDGRRIVR